jgi:hypothetical protein
MGKLKGILQLTGNFDGLSFFERDGKIIVRRTGGFDGKAIKTQDNYVRTRENASEFGHCSTVSKQLRRALFSYLRKIKTPYLYSYVTGQLTTIMKCDTVSERGKRSVGAGTATAEGQQLWKGFEFNKALSFSQMVASPYAVNMAEGKVVFDAFDARLVAFPAGATHIALQFLLLRCDFERGLFALGEGERKIVGQKDAVSRLGLTAVAPDGEGVVLGLVFGEFLQEVNGELYELEGCGLGVVGVG